MEWAIHIRRVIERLGDDMTFTPSGGDDIPFIGLFLGPSQAIDFGQGAFQTNATQIFAMTADLPGLAVNDVLMRGTTRYVVRRPPEPDLLGAYVRFVIGRPGNAGGSILTDDGAGILTDDGETIETDS